MTITEGMFLSAGFTITGSIMLFMLIQAMKEDLDRPRTVKQRVTRHAKRQAKHDVEGEDHAAQVLPASLINDMREKHWAHWTRTYTNEVDRLTDHATRTRVGLEHITQTRERTQRALQSYRQALDEIQ